MEPQLPILIAQSETENSELFQTEDTEQTARLETLSQAFLRELLEPSLQKARSRGLQAQLWILDGQYLLHYQAENGEEHFKFISPHSVRLAFSRIAIDSGWLNPGICRWGAVKEGQWLVKFIPPAGDYSLQLKLPDNSRDEQASAEPHMPVELTSIPLPGLIFVGAGREYYLWAVKEAAFNPDSTLYAAPLPNLYEDGKVCWGENQPSVATATSIEAAWQLFIGSEFTDHLVQSKSLAFPQDVRHQLLALAGGGSGAGKREGRKIREKKSRHKEESSLPATNKSYPLDDLVQYRRGLGQAGVSGVTVEMAVAQVVAKFS